MNMERITKPGYKFNILNILQGLNKYADIDEVMNRLAAYENTGLTPEEIIDGRLLTGWIPVSERLPKKQQSVIVRLSSGGTQIGWILWNEWAWDGYKCTGAVVTHWMPLPQPPKEG